MLEIILFFAIFVLGVAAWRQNDRMHRIERELNAVREDYLATTRTAAAPAEAVQTPVATAEVVQAPVAAEAAAAERVSAPVAEELSEREKAKREAMAKAAAMLDEEERQRKAAGPRTVPAAARAQPASTEPTAKRPDIETALGTRWAVWVGGLALALGGVFLIRYTIEAGIFGPAVRLTLAGLMGLALVGGGEFLRRTGFKVPVEGLQNAYLPAILTAIGAFMLFGTVYAAYGVYGYFGPTVAFALLGIIAVGTVAAALVHGQALGALGLLGAFVTPALVSSTAPNFWALFGYLAIVLVAAAVIARVRNWALLMSGGLVGAGVWALLYLLFERTSGVEAFNHAVILFIAAVMIVSLAVLWLGRENSESETGVDAPSIVGAILLGLMGLALFTNPFLTQTGGAWRGALIVAALLGVAAWRDRALALLHAAGAVTVLAWLRLAFSGTFDLDAFGEQIVIDGAPVLANADGFKLIGAVLGAAFVAVGFWRARAFIATSRSAIWTGWAVAVPLVILGALWLSFGHLDRDLMYALFAAGLTIVLVAGGEWLARAEEPPLTGGLAVSLAYAGACLALLYTLVMGFSAGWTTILIGAAAVLPALATRMRSYPILGWIAGAAAVVVLARAAMDPTIVGPFFLSKTPVFNWLLPGYGVPALAFGFAAWQLKRTTDGSPRMIMEAAAAIFSLLTVAMLVRHAMNGGVLEGEAPTLAEQSIYTLIALCFGAILIAIDMRSPSSVMRIGSLAAGVVSIAMIVMQHFLLLNPLFTDESTGQITFFNLLFLGYLLPAIAAGALAWYARGKRPKWYSAGIALVGAVLVFAYFTLSVRRLFQGEFIAAWRGMEQIETYSYSALWLVLGVVLLTTGMMLRSYVLRIASAVLIVIAVAKVFIFDMSELEGVLRALSFIGLGAVLIGIGLFYQRMLVRTSKSAAAEAAEQTTPPQPA
ncbi:MAG TPA: DUF2339 domain-containing protein [Rhizobiaceae bacterium]|nr:DUF2339 domain-containing protein [Rhizobiaceae bacterium]